MIVDSKEEIQSMYEFLDKEGYEFNECNPFGIRDYSGIEKGVYNDTIGLLCENEMYLFKGTTDPSPYYIEKKPMNANGTAVMCSGLQHKIWMVGSHARRCIGLINGWRGRHGTKRQTVKRLDKKYRFKKKIYRGWFACNLHPAFDNNFSYIGRNSAGCQVIANEKEFQQYMGYIMISDEYKANKHTLYSYYLFEEGSIARRIAEML